MDFWTTCCKKYLDLKTQELSHVRSCYLELWYRIEKLLKYDWPRMKLILRHSVKVDIAFRNSPNKGFENEQPCFQGLSLFNWVGKESFKNTVFVDRK